MIACLALGRLQPSLRGLVDSPFFPSIVIRNSEFEDCSDEILQHEGRRSLKCHD